MGEIARWQSRITRIVRLVIERKAVASLEWGGHRVEHALGSFVDWELPDPGTSHDQQTSYLICDPVLEGRCSPYVFSPRFIYGLRGVVFEPRSGVTFLGGLALAESTAEPVDTLLHLTPMRMRPSGHIEGPATGLAATSYYHWLIEQLPAALRAINAHPGTEVLAWANSPMYMRQAIGSLGLPTRALTEPVTVANFVLGGQAADSGRPRPSDIATLREATRSLRTGNASRRLFIGRGSGSRAPLWEREMAERLAQLDFEVFVPENLDWADQVRRLSEATIVVGVHGGALANIAFCEPGTPVVEIAPAIRPVTCFEALAGVADLPYTRLLVQPTPANQFGDLESIWGELEEAVRSRF